MIHNNMMHEHEVKNWLEKERERFESIMDATEKKIAVGVIIALEGVLNE